MRNDIAISVENLSKLYQLGQVGTGTLSHDLNRWWHKLRGKEDPYLKLGQENKRDAAGSEWVWALKDVSFEVKEGEVLGIIGKNGAGKSTLLKLLSRVTSPTTGHIRARGRIASLLEVGTGFHPELTGRENIFLNGAILGMTKAEIKRKFDEIVAFAGVERYVDTPVKRYSSGMYVRLAFAVAAHLEPEILIVDEVLAVGDVEFQNKCIGKMKDVSNKEGRTVLFVSHNMSAIKNLCPHSILMTNGKIVLDASTKEVIDEYLTGGLSQGRIIVNERADAFPNDSIFVESIGIFDAAGRLDNIFTTSDDIYITAAYKVKNDIKDLRVSMTLYNSEGDLILASSDFEFQNESRSRYAGNHESICKIPGRLLNAGKYQVKIHFDIPFQRPLVMDIELSFSIDEVAFNQMGITLNRIPGGLIHPYLEWKINSKAE